jgi:hypothetical protein
MKMPRLFDWQKASFLLDCRGVKSPIFRNFYAPKTIHLSAYHGISFLANIKHFFKAITL